MPDPELLSIFGQAFPHDEAYLVGNRVGLEALKKAIDQALAKGKGKGEVFVADGEGFDVLVVCIEDPWHSRIWDILAEPYKGEAFRETRGDAVWPWRL